MIDPHLIAWLCLILLLALDLTIEATRAAYINTNLARLLGQSDQTLPEANRTLRLLADMPRLQTSFNLIQSLTRFLLAGLALWLFIPVDKSGSTLWFAAGVLILSALVVFLLERIVELIVARSPETWAARLTVFSLVIKYLAMPVLALPLRFSKTPKHEHESSVTEDELMSLVQAGQQEGVLERDEHKMIVSIFRLGDTLAREIMVPRIDIVALEANTSFQQAVDTFLSTGHSRVPVYQETVDNIQGILYAKDLLRVWSEGGQPASLTDLARLPYFVPEAKKVDDLMAEMQSRRVHLAIVVDEYGGVAGLVSLEDIVEEIVGEIHDEYDQAEESLYQALGVNDYLFQGRIDLGDFNEIMGSELPKSEADTLGGLIYSRIGRVPAVGDQLQIDDLQLTVEQVSGRRIRKVRAQKLPLDSENGEIETHVDE